MSLTVASIDSSSSARRFVSRREKRPAASVERQVTKNLIASDFHSGSCELVFVSQRKILQQHPFLTSSGGCVCVPFDVTDTVATMTRTKARVIIVPTVHPTAL